MISSDNMPTGKKKSPPTKKSNYSKELQQTSTDVEASRTTVTIPSDLLHGAGQKNSPRDFYIILKMQLVF